MGIIRKKTGTRGTEGGLKFICDVCSADITATVRIHCADDACHEYDLCVPCFSQGESSREHDPRTHAFSVIEQHAVPVFSKDWGADEELLLLEGAEVYGLGSWADIADHIGGYRSKDEVRNHYIETYIDSTNFPLPARADPGDQDLLEETPREMFQANKKRRIEESMQLAKNSTLTAPKQKPTASTPACHEVQGYMPGRLEFETEFVNDAEEAVQHMQFEPGEGTDLQDTENDPEVELKMAIKDIYNSKLTQRVLRKKTIFEHKLLEYRKNALVDKRRTKDQNILLGRIKPFCRLLSHDDLAELGEGLIYEHDLRQAIAQLQEWRQNQVTDLRSGEKYESEKIAKILRGGVQSSTDRLPSNRISKSFNADQPTSKDLLIGLALPERLKAWLPPDELANGIPETTRTSALYGSIANVTPWNTDFVLELTDGHLLSRDEALLCSTLRISPKAYITLKEICLKKGVETGGSLKRKQIKDLLPKMDPSKSTRLLDFFVHSGWIVLA